MGAENNFQVLARMPKHTRGNPTQITMALARAYGLDPATMGQAFATAGVVIRRADTLEEARAWARRIREFGADAVILNAFGSVVAEVLVAPAPATGAPQAPQQATDKTLMGFSAPPVSGAPPVSAPTDIGLAQTMMGGSPPDGPVKELMPLDLSGSSADQPQRPVDTGEALKQVDAEALVMLDGSVEQRRKADSKSFDVTVEDGAFAPPVQNESLELEAIDLPERGTMAEMEEEPEEEAAPSSPQIRAGIASGSALRRPSASPLDTVRDFLAAWPRVRILIGFALALGLGAVVPTCYSEGVYEERIQPLLKDLSTARAHGELMKDSEGYRSPAEITRQIDSVKTRYGINTFLMWMIIAGGLGAGWYYLTRES